MFETQKEEERVLLLGVTLPEQENSDMSMAELESLAKTAGAKVIDGFV